MVTKKDKTKFNYIEYMTGIVNSIKPGQIVQRIIIIPATSDYTLCKLVKDFKLDNTGESAPDVRSLQRKEKLVAHSYKIIGIENVDSTEKRNSLQTRKVFLEYIGTDKEFSLKDKIYHWSDLVPYCQFEIQKEADL